MDVKAMHNRGVELKKTIINKRYVLGILLTLFKLNVLIAQDRFDEKLLCDKKWIISEYNIAGRIFPATGIKLGDHTIFFQDHTVKSKDGGLILNSKWKFEESTNTITLFSENDETKTNMEIINLSIDTFEWKTTNPEGIEMIVKMNFYKK